MIKQNKKRNALQRAFTVYSKHVFPRVVYTLSACLIFEYGVEYTRSVSPELKTKQEVQYALDEEAKELNLLEKNILVQLVADGTCRGDALACSGKIGDNTYSISLEEDGRTRNILRHELYHIADEHCDEEWSTFKYFSLWEPQAVVYEVWGWRL